MAYSSIYWRSTTVMCRGTGVGMQNTLVTVDGRADTPTHTQKQDTPGHFFEREPIGASTIGNRLSTDEQIPFPIQQRVVLRTDISQEDADLTIFKLTRCATMLRPYSYRFFAA